MPSMPSKFTPSVQYSQTINGSLLHNMCTPATFGHGWHFWPGFLQLIAKTSKSILTVKNQLQYLFMGKKIGLKQLSQKTYKDVPGLSKEFTQSFGAIEDAFDCLIYGFSGNGKTNFIVMVLKELINALKQKCEYISFEEGHTKTIRTTLIERHGMYEAVGNLMSLTDHLTFDELVNKMGKRKSAKIWVIDSIQASHFTELQCAELKKKFVLSRKKKIIFYISWADGKQPKGATAKAVEYHAHIKIKVEGLMAFFKSRFGGNKNFVIWEDGAIKYWGRKKYNKLKTL
jgi:hypothetical protein